MADINREDPIFIQGILPRSGTNFLWDLLLLHPDCGPAIDPVREDLFLDRSDHLVEFADAARNIWDPLWGEFTPALMHRLLASLGEGLIAFLWEDRTKRLVTKSPSVQRLSRFFLLFPHARLLVLIRDGRAVTQSCMDTFGWDFERAAQAWAGAAREIQAFRAAEGERADRWRVVRYEDLVDRLDEEVPRLLEFLELDPMSYDLDAAQNLPVRGSSTFFGPGRSSVHWEPVRKDTTFAPNQRWRSWSAAQVERFEWIAGDEMRSLGYGIEAPGGRSFADASKHHLLDGWWAARQGTTRARTRLAIATRPFRQRVGLTR